VLVVEDYDPLRKSVVRGLQGAGYAVDATRSGSEGLAFASCGDYDAIVLDLMLPDLDGLTLLARARERGCSSPVLVLTAKDKVNDRVRGLDVGADDYLVKPFAFEELLARIRALVRRRYRSGSSLVRVGELEIDTAGRTVRVGGVAVNMTAREYSILEMLAMRAGQIVTRDEIAEHIYDWARDVGSNVVDVYVGYIRRKLREAGLPPLLRTHRGLGYSLEASE
jgi:DNA-binding response OmpR family regulator